MKHKQTFTNVNISSNDHQFTYIVELVDSDITSIHTLCMNDIYEIDNNGYKRDGNCWSDNNDPEQLFTFNAKDAILRLYFPQYSVETYNRGGLYALDLHMYIGYKKISLGTYILNRKDALASQKIFKYLNQEYYECIDLNIIDPRCLIYDSSCELVRKHIKCGEDLNNDGAMLCVSLHPIEYNNDIYIIKEGYDGSQNNIFLGHSSDYLNINLKYEYGRFSFKLNYNEDYIDLAEYLEDTYGWKNITLKYLLSVTGHNPNGFYCESYINEFSIINSNLYNMFKNNSQWAPGMSFIGKVIVYSDNVEKLILTSNKLPITKELFAKVILSDPLKIEIDETDMGIQIINKIEQNITEYDIPNNSKSNIIIPTFYRVRDLGQVIIHPEVTENVCINLDNYKSKVKSFVMKVEGVNFKEIGTTSSGTIFKVVGSMLPRNNQSGTFYIMNQDGELITTGKYTYEL